MSTTLKPVEYDGRVGQLGARLQRDGWDVPEDQVVAFATVLPAAEGMPEAAVVGDGEAAFVVGDTLVVASFDKDRSHLSTDLFALPGVPLRIVWNAEWLSEYGPGDLRDAPDERPMTVTLSSPGSDVYELPFDAAWSNPVGCINFVSVLTLKAHGFEPGVGTAHQTRTHRTWKR